MSTDEAPKNNRLMCSVTITALIPLIAVDLPMKTDWEFFKLTKEAKENLEGRGYTPEGPVTRYIQERPDLDIDKVKLSVTMTGWKDE